MDKNLQYYLNHSKNECVTIPSHLCTSLMIKNYLSEFKTDEEKQIAQDNLGVTDKLKILKNILDNKVIEIGGIPWDIEPTEGHTEQILSSDAIYKALSKYKSNETIDTIIQTLWNNVISKINSIDENIKQELQTLIPTLIDNHINERVVDLQNQIDALDIHGIAVSNEFGTDSHISISQKTMTDAINKLWQKLEDMTGEVLQGISMSVTPEYFISEDGCSVHISANTVETNGIFEHIAFYGNGSLIAEADNVDFFEYDTEITETTIIKCVAKIMGVEYTRQQIVTHYNSFWLGAGTAASDIMDVEHVIPITNGMRGAYDVDVAQGQHIIIIVGESLAGGFLRADLNSVEINFTESTVTVDGKNYKVFTSEEAYSAGTYNIDING